MARYLFDDWEMIARRIKGRKIFLFLDFDGTLSPIAPTPEKAVLPKKTGALLEKISKSPYVKMAFISGRSLSDLKKKVGIKNVIFVGNHGLEMEGPGIRHRTAVSISYKRVMERIKNDLLEKTTCIPGVFIEDKGFTISLHYRLVERRRIDLLKKIFYETVILFMVNENIVIEEGKMVFEIKPAVPWDKGKAVSWLLSKKISESKADGVIPFYLGDDTTDESAFPEVKKIGFAVRVGGPKKTNAEYYLKDTDEVGIFLNRLSREI